MNGNPYALDIYLTYITRQKCEKIVNVIQKNLFYILTSTFLIFLEEIRNAVSKKMTNIIIKI